MWTRDAYYKGLPTVKDEEGKVLPKEIDVSKHDIYCWNDWYLDEIAPEQESPEDKMIAAIDGEDDEPSHFVYGDKQVQCFEMHELVQLALSPFEQQIFYMHYIEGTPFREIGAKLGKGHTQIYAVYKRSLEKLREYVEEHLSL